LSGARPGRVLVLNGTSSSGKTSLAKALQAILPEPHQHVQLDAFRAMEPTGYWDELDNDTAKVRIAALCHAMHAAVAAFARNGQHVILDTVLDRASAARYLVDDLGSTGFSMIGVHCALDEIERRETTRGDRPSGLARRQFELIHASRTYDFSVDTTHTSAAACAAEIAAWLEGRNHSPA
jgi:chloramphenicol 3-O phosphotransferase